MARRKCWSNAILEMQAAARTVIIPPRPAGIIDDAAVYGALAQIYTSVQRYANPGQEDLFLAEWAFRTREVPRRTLFRCRCLVAQQRQSDILLEQRVRVRAIYWTSPPRAVTYTGGSLIIYIEYPKFPTVRKLKYHRNPKGRSHQVFDDAASAFPSPRAGLRNLKVTRSNTQQRLADEVKEPCVVLDVRIYSFCCYRWRSAVNVRAYSWGCKAAFQLWPPSD